MAIFSEKAKKPGLLTKNRGFEVGLWQETKVMTWMLDLILPTDESGGFLNKTIKGFQRRYQSTSTHSIWTNPNFAYTFNFCMLSESITYAR
jgi:hypothetical protein